MTTNATDWPRIEQEAREQARAELEARENTPLVFGDYIAWVDCRFGLTDGVGEAHRVGFPKGDDPYTTCGVPIPSPALWLPLNPDFIRSLGPCRFCEAEFTRALHENQETAA